jgi:hypothetical protein
MQRLIILVSSVNRDSFYTELGDVSMMSVMLASVLKFLTMV